MFRNTRVKSRKLSDAEAAAIAQIGNIPRMGPAQGHNRVILMGEKATSEAKALLVAAKKYPVHMQHVSSEFAAPVLCNSEDDLRYWLSRVIWRHGHYVVIRKAHDGRRPKDERGPPISLWRSESDARISGGQGGSGTMKWF